MTNDPDKLRESVGDDSYVECPVCRKGMDIQDIFTNERVGPGLGDECPYCGAPWEISIHIVERSVPATKEPAPSEWHTVSVFSDNGKIVSVGIDGKMVINEYPDGPLAHREDLTADQRQTLDATLAAFNREVVDAQAVLPRSAPWRSRTTFEGVKVTLLPLTDDERAEFFGLLLRAFCRYCGQVQPDGRECQCENDE